MAAVRVCSTTEPRAVRLRAPAPVTVILSVPPPAVVKVTPVAAVAVSVVAVIRPFDVNEIAPTVACKVTLFAVIEFSTRSPLPAISVIWLLELGVETTLIAPVAVTVIPPLAALRFCSTTEPREVRFRAPAPVTLIVSLSPPAVVRLTPVKAVAVSVAVVIILPAACEIAPTVATKVTLVAVIVFSTRSPLPAVSVT